VLGRASTVGHLAWVRSIRLEPRVTEPIRRVGDLGGGRLLIYFPDEELSDGASEFETGGFFDVQDAPPWDTWLALFPYQRPPYEGRSFEPEEYLVSYVPPEFVSLVQGGIDVNPVDCVTWLEDANVPLVAELQSRGVLS
jgi:hypothetical protein